MTGLSVGAGASTFAHGVHYAVLGLGLLGLLVLLAPWAPRRRDPVPVDEHDRRILELRGRIAAGALGSSRVDVLVPPAARAAVRPQEIWRPLAVVSTTAAAGVHAAVGPAHFREQVVLGLFFAVTALAQVVWSIALVFWPSTALVTAGLVGNMGLVALWLFTRTVGFPGLLPGPEAVGAWDLACVAWECVAVVGCVLALGVIGGSTHRRLLHWRDWDPRVQVWLGLSVVGLGVLTISGAGA